MPLFPEGKKRKKERRRGHKARERHGLGRGEAAPSRPGEAALTWRELEPALGTHPGVARGERGVRFGPPRAAPAGGGSPVPLQPGAASGAVRER